MGAIRRFVRRVAERFRPERAIRFGTYAYGRPHADSDVDRPVVMPTWNEHDEAARIRLAVPAPFLPDRIVRTPRHLRWRLRAGGLVRARSRVPRPRTL